MFVLFSACLIVFMNLLTKIINIVVIQFNIVDIVKKTMIFFIEKITIIIAMFIRNIKFSSSEIVLE